MKDVAALQPPIGNPALSRGYRRENAHLCEHEIYLREVADFIGVSERQLSRLFREHDGRSVTGYVTERRLERARTMLAEGHSAKETAYTCGFKDPAYFCRCFKRHTGHAPSLHL